MAKEHCRMAAVLFDLSKKKKNEKVAENHFHNRLLQLEERMDEAEPCHNYKGKGAGPEGCW